MSGRRWSSRSRRADAVRARGRGPVRSAGARAAVFRARATLATLAAIGAALATVSCGAISAGGARHGASPAGALADRSAPVLSWDGGRALFTARPAAGAAPRLFESRADGAGPREVSAGRGSPADPAYLPDGRILFTDRAAAGDARREDRSLYVVRPDGSGLERVTYAPGQDAAPRIIADGRVRYEHRPPPAVDGALAAAVEMTIHPDGTGVALAVAPADVEARDHALPRAAADAAAPAAGAAARPRPPILTSVVNPDKRSGTLLCLDVYDTDLPALRGLPRGAVRAVRVSIAGRPAAAEAPVFEDGSFFVEVPADAPLRLALLDARGGETAILDGGLWVRPNENRGCLGCHEDRRRAPENRQPLAVRDPAVSLVPRLLPSAGPAPRTAADGRD